MHRSLAYGVFLILLTVAGACDGGIGFSDVAGSGTVVSETRSISDFDTILLAGEGVVVVTVGEPTGLMVATDDNLLTHIETTVQDNTLTIRTESGIDLDPTDSVTYLVSTPSLTAATLTGAGSIELADVETAAFSVELTGAGGIDVAGLDADRLDVQISGAGGVEISGAVDTQVVEIPGAGNYDARDLESVEANVTTSGVGSATVWVTGSLDATVTGVGGIDYFGSPAVTQSVTGVGTVTANDGG